MRNEREREKKRERERERQFNCTCCWLRIMMRIEPGTCPRQFGLLCAPREILPTKQQRTRKIGHTQHIEDLIPCKIDPNIFKIDWKYTLVLKLQLIKIESQFKYTSNYFTSLLYPLAEYKTQKSVKKPVQKKTKKAENSEYTVSNAFLLAVESTKLPSGQTACRRNENTNVIHIQMKIDCEFVSHISRKKIKNKLR